MGVAVAAAKFRDHDSAGRAVHAARQSDPGAEGASAAHRRLHPALGRAAHVQLVGKPGVGDLSNDLQKQYASLIGDREPIVLHARLPGMGAATRYHHPHRRRQPRPARHIMRQAHRRRRRLRRAAEQARLSPATFAQ